MTRWQAVPILAAAVLLLPAAGRAQASQPGVDFDGVKAVFSDPDRATTYSVLALTDDDAAATCCTYKWTLTLTDVDTTKGVDTFCNNHGVLSGTEATFVWHHGNKGDAIHDDGCDHSLQGMYGHQGLITVVVSDNKGSQCTATYKGTLDSSDNFTPIDRRNRIVKITVERTCQKRVLTPIRLAVAFKENGNLALAKSKLR